MIEAMIAVAVLSGVALAGTHMVTGFLSTQKSMTADSNIQDLLNEAHMAFKNPVQCSANIPNFSTTTLTAANYANLRIIVNKWTLNGNNFLVNLDVVPGITNSKISLSIEKFQPISATEYKALAYFNIERGQQVSGGSTRSRHLPINLITTGNTITSCSFSAVEMLSEQDLELVKADVCTSFGGTYDTVTKRCSIAAPTKEAICTSLGGTYNATSERCSISSPITSQIATAGSCPAGKVVSGIDSAGRVICVTQSGGPGNSVTSVTNNTNTTVVQNPVTTTTTPATPPPATPPATPPAQVNCPGGNSTAGSPNGSNTCQFTWQAASPYESVIGTATGGGAINGTCQPNGVWQYAFVCPDRTGVTCNGGQRNWYSLSGRTTCTCSFPQANEGQSVTASCNTGSVSGTCGAGGWTYSAVCQDPNVITCPAGAGQVGSRSTSGRICTCNYNATAAGGSVNIGCTNGGTISGTCSSTGQWTNVVVNCP